MQIRIEDFSGIIPKKSARLLGQSNATSAISTELYSGELRGLKSPTFVRSVGATAYRAYSASIQQASPSLDYTDEWVIFDDNSIDFFRGPNINDEHQRYYWAGNGTDPKVVQGEDLITFGGDIDSAPTFLWGIPNPQGEPSVTPPSYDFNDPVEVRSYTYTFINDWDEESAPVEPSDPETGHADPVTGGDWVVSNIDTSYGIGGSWSSLKAVRIYRTITGSTGNADFRFVAEIPIATLIASSGQYYDGIPSTRVTLNETLTSTYYEPPPGVLSGDPYTLDGLVQLPNGFFAGFIGSDVYFSEPYLPYAWPRKYRKSVGSRIIGLGVYSSGLVVCTDSNPKVLTGAHPEAMTMIDLDQAEPCLSRRSIVSTSNGVVYASPNGLVKATESGAGVVSTELISRKEWQTLYRPSQMQGAINGQGYIGIYSASKGMIIGPDVGNGAMVDIGNVSYIRTIQTNEHDGEVFIIRNGGLYQWNVTSAKPLPFLWESKTFETKVPVNFAAFKVKWEINNEVQTGQETIDSVPYNSAVFAAGPIHTYNQFTFNTSGPVPIKVPRSSLTAEQFYPDIIKMPLGGSDLIGPRTISLDGGVRITVMARKKNQVEFTKVYQRLVTDEEQHHLPSTFKADLWRVRIESSNDVYSFVMGETGKELVNV